MKKTFLIILALFVSALMLVSCGEKTEESSFDVDSIKTLGDILKLEAESPQSAQYENLLIYVFELNGNYYRAKADLTPEQSDALWDLSFMDDDYDAKFSEIVSDIAVTSVENLSEQILTESQLKSLVGKTGQELFDEGWENGNGYNLENMEFWMDYGPFEYSVIMEGHIDESEYDTFSEDKISDMKVKSVSFFGVGDATDFDFE